MDSATALKRQRGKAKKKEVPARIISLPVEKPPAPVSAAPAAHPAAAERGASRPGARPAGARPATPGARGTVPARPAAGPGTPPAVEEKKDVKGKKKVKRPEVPDADRAKPVKKREVRERADLYSGAEGEHRGLRPPERYEKGG